MPHLSLVNILADKRLVPEFMPYFRSTEPITAAAEQMLSNPADLARIANELKALTRPLFKNASENVASIITDMLETRVLEDL
jgi:lipid A disaccharide synthetase